MIDHSSDIYALVSIQLQKSLSGRNTKPKKKKILSVKEQWGYSACHAMITLLFVHMISWPVLTSTWPYTGCFW